MKNKGISQDTILSLNKDGSNSIDLHREALIRAGVQPDGGASILDIQKKRMRNKASGLNANTKNNEDDLYKTIIKLKKSGLLPEMLRKAGIRKEHLIENMVSVGTPIVPMMGAPSYSRPKNTKDTGNIKNIKKIKINKNKILRNFYPKEQL